MSWHVYVTCGLCSAKTASFTDDDPDTAGKQADSAALKLGWVPLGPVRADDRHRAPTWVCKPCAGDVAGGFLEAGRRVQRPEPLPTLDSPAPPDGIAAAREWLALPEAVRAMAVEVVENRAAQNADVARRLRERGDAAELQERAKEVDAASDAIRTLARLGREQGPLPTTVRQIWPPLPAPSAPPGHPRGPHPPVRKKA